jgi:hypothetical protein
MQLTYLHRRHPFRRVTLKALSFRWYQSLQESTTCVQCYQPLAWQRLHKVSPCWHHVGLLQSGYNKQSKAHIYVYKEQTTP